jgi:hypothetical protein
MLIDLPTATCSNARCQLAIDLTDDRLVMTKTADGGAFITCPHCGGATLVPKELMTRAKAGRRNLRP